MSEDAEHLRLLSIFHYVLAGLTACGSCVPLIYVLFGLMMITGAQQIDRQMQQDMQQARQMMQQQIQQAEAADEEIQELPPQQAEMPERQIEESEVQQPEVDDARADHALFDDPQIQPRVQQPQFPIRSMRAPMATFGEIVIAIGAIASLLGWGYALCLMLAGRFLSTRRHLTFCLVVAGLSCLHIPFGTVLGVFSFIVLLRPSVKELFETQFTPANTL